MAKVILFDIGEDLLSLLVAAAIPWRFEAWDDVVALVHVDFLLQIHVLKTLSLMLHRGDKFLRWEDQCLLEHAPAESGREFFERDLVLVV